MLKKLLGVAAVSLIVAVGAMADTAQGSRGRGTAVGEGGVPSHFRYEALKVEHDGHVRVGGWLSHMQPPGDNRPPVNIMCRMVREVAVSGEHNNLCAFSGPGVLTTRRNGHVVQIQGMVGVHVNDRFREGQGDPDMYAVAFKNRNGETIYTFAGLVRDGGLSVFKRTQ